MQKLNAVIIEDEPKSRDTLRNMMAKFLPEVNIVYESSSLEDSILPIKKLNPDLVFLDIELPGDLGIHINRYFPSPDFDLIFTTAYEKYALHAFNNSAIAYLLKPIDLDQLISAVSKVANKRYLQKTKNEKNKLDGFNKLCLHTSHGLTFIDSNQIIYCEADHNYTLFYFASGKKIMANHPLRFYEEILDSNRFFRINRSVIINLDYLKEYIKSNHGELILSNNQKFSLSINRKEEFLKKIGY